MAEAQHAEASKQPPPERAPERAGEDPGSLARRAVAPSFQGQRLDPRGLSPQAILALQRTVGNAAVNRLLGQAALGRPAPRVGSSAERIAVQPSAGGGAMPGLTRDSGTRRDLVKYVYRNEQLVYRFAGKDELPEAEQASFVNAIGLVDLDKLKRPPGREGPASGDRWVRAVEALMDEVATAMRGKTGAYCARGRERSPFAVFAALVVNDGMDPRLAKGAVVAAILGVEADADLFERIMADGSWFGLYVTRHKDREREREKEKERAQKT